MSGDKSPIAHAPPTAEQIRSRRTLLLVFGFIFVVWVGMMVVMYFGTVYRHRHPAPSPSSSLPVVDTRS